MASMNTSPITGPAAIGATTRTRRRSLPVIPPNFFGIAFGLAGLAELWVYATPIWGVSDVVGRVMELVAAVCRAGGFGILQAQLCPPDRLRAEIRRLRTLTTRRASPTFATRAVE